MDVESTWENVDLYVNVEEENNKESVTDTTETDPETDYVPMTFSVIGLIQKQPCTRPVLVLFDTGSETTWIQRSRLPSGAVSSTVDTVTGNTMAGQMKSNQAVVLEHVALPEFHQARSIERINARVFEQPCRYDIIFGRDVIRMLGLQLDFQDHVMTWDDSVVTMKKYPKKPEAGEPSIATAMLWNCLEDDLEDVEDLFQVEIPSDSSAEFAGNGYLPPKAKILSSKYDRADVDQIARTCTHLTTEQQKQLADVLRKFPKLFSGELGCYPNAKVHLEVDPEAKPHRSRYYPVAKVHESLFKEELDRLVQIGVLERAT